MTRKPRMQSSIDVYHVTMRGVGRRVIFENDMNREKFLEYLVSHKEKGNIKLLAWCLMDNHVHLVVQSEIGCLSKTMHDLCAAYAMYFNVACGHVGHVFQGRYGSFPIEHEDQLYACVRYVHLNPTAAGLCAPEEYKWSSYSQYLGEGGICDTSLIASYFGGEEAVRRYHENNSNSQTDETFENVRVRISLSQAAIIAESLFGLSFREDIPNMSKNDRNEAIRSLYLAGLSGGQIERLTGIGRGIIQRIVTRARMCKRALCKRA